MCRQKQELLPCLFLLTSSIIASTSSTADHIRKPRGGLNVKYDSFGIPRFDGRSFVDQNFLAVQSELNPNGNGDDTNTRASTVPRLADRSEENHDQDVMTRQKWEPLIAAIRQNKARSGKPRNVTKAIGSGDGAMRRKTAENSDGPSAANIAGAETEPPRKSLAVEPPEPVEEQRVKAAPAIGEVIRISGSTGVTIGSRSTVRTTVVPTKVVGTVTPSLSPTSTSLGSSLGSSSPALASSAPSTSTAGLSTAVAVSGPIPTETPTTSRSSPESSVVTTSATSPSTPALTIPVGVTTVTVSSTTDTSQRPIESTTVNATASTQPIRIVMLTEPPSPGASTPASPTFSSATITTNASSPNPNKRTKTHEASVQFEVSRDRSPFLVDVDKSLDTGIKEKATVHEAANGTGTVQPKRKSIHKATTASPRLTIPHQPEPIGIRPTLAGPFIPPTLQTTTPTVTTVPFATLSGQPSAQPPNWAPSTGFNSPAGGGLTVGTALSFPAGLQPVPSGSLLGPGGFPPVGSLNPPRPFARPATAQQVDPSLSLPAQFLAPAPIVRFPSSQEQLSPAQRIAEPGSIFFAAGLLSSPSTSESTGTCFCPCSSPGAIPQTPSGSDSDCVGDHCPVQKTVAQQPSASSQWISQPNRSGKVLADISPADQFFGPPIQGTSKQPRQTPKILLE